MGFSGWKVLARALRTDAGRAPLWRNPEPRSEYDAIIIGDGGHALATAYYLARNHAMSNLAVLATKPLGTGDDAGDGSVIGADYLLPGNSEFHSQSLRLWEGLSAELNYDVMYSPRGLFSLFHSDQQRDAAARRGNAMVNQGDDAVLLDRNGLRELLPCLDYDQARFPIHGALYHPRGGIAQHEAAVWGFARAADRRGVDILQNCEVTGIDVVNGRVIGLQTGRGAIRSKKIGLALFGDAGGFAAMAGINLPLESRVVQEFVTEALRPCLDRVIRFGMGCFSIGQSRRGGLVLGGDIDAYARSARRHHLPMAENVMEAGMALLPMIGRASVQRSRMGRMDASPDGAPIIDRTAVEGLFLACGGGVGGFNAVPAAGLGMAHLMATSQPHEIARRFRLDRFAAGYFLDECCSNSQYGLL
jgi:heterotetrameric sarcosine oxidase beta subunit